MCLTLKKLFLKHKIKVIIVIIMVAYYFILPNQLFKTSTSTVVFSKNGVLLGAVIASDGQWRFPEIDTVPQKFKKCITQFEDAYFYNHIGVNPISIFKALKTNYKAGKIVRGGSTITQQVIRLSRGGHKRTYVEKLIEMVLATRLEWRYSKDRILALYTSHAPFGGNVVGLEMAAFRYYGLKPYQLTWAESATLAVLPNAPALIYPGKNQLQLAVKRNKLLYKLYQNNIIDSVTYTLSIQEPLPQKPYLLPKITPHLVQEVANHYKGKKVKTSIDLYLQKQVNELVQRHYQKQKQNEVHNLAVLVADVNTRKILAYVGNTPTDKHHQKDVNNVIAARSTGSTLKPLLYAHMLQSGDLLPNQLVADVPTNIAGYSPKNFNQSFSGASPANVALTRSLNIPAVRLLQRYGLQKFRDDLSEYHIHHLNKSADYYGLSLILGGSEASLWDLCKIYAAYAGLVNHYEPLKHKYYKNEFIDFSYLNDYQTSFGKTQKIAPIIDAGSVYTTLNTLTEVNRPGDEQAWRYYNSSQKIAWKTGTSYGNKDAWSIGVTPKYVVGVWVGNSDGEGRPSLTGAASASPLMFEVFNILPKVNWFLEPYEDLIQTSICTVSGELALPICPSEKRRVPVNAIKGATCQYHLQIQLDRTGRYRVNTSCESVDNIITKTWFNLPPLMAHYYKQNHTDYYDIPPYKLGCQTNRQDVMAFVSPAKRYAKISLTKDVDGEVKPTVLKVTHNDQNAILYWYIDAKFVKTTTDVHELALKVNKGKYQILVIDEKGNELSRILEID